MVKINYFIFLLCFSIKFTVCARILAVFPTPSISHHLVFRPLINELVRRGHEVTVITTDPQYPPGQTPDNLTEIDVHDVSYKVWKDEFAKAPNENTVDILSQVRTTIKILLKLVIAQIDTSRVQHLIREKKGEFDLLFIEAFVKPALIYSHFFKVPVIQISSFSGLSHNYKAIGAVEHPFLYPSIVQQRYYNLTKWEKIQMALRYWRLQNIFDEANEDDDKALQSKYGSDFPSLNELCDNIHMLFLNTHPVWLNNQPVPPNVIYIRGIDMKPPKILPKDLQTILDTSKNGIIYFSLGTSINHSLIPLEKILIFIKVFSQLPYDVIWKWNGDVLPGKSKNIYVFKWLPQADLLKHPNMKLFINQAGLHSTDEAIRAGVPLVGIPIQVDQWYNAEKYVYHRIGVHLEMSNLNEEILHDAIVNVISDKSYRDNIVRLCTLMDDERETALERAMWWTDYVLRHGAKHLRAAGANISRTQYYELELVTEVVFFVLFIIIVAIISIYKIVKFVNACFTIKKKISFLYPNSDIIKQLVRGISDKMTTVLFLSVLFILNVGDISAARILAVFPTPSISHQVVFRPLTSELARRGHEVTVVTTDPAYPPGQAPNNLTEIDVHDLSYKLWKEEFPSKSVGSKEDIYNQITKIFTILFKLIISQIETKEVQDIIKTKKYDLLLLEAYTKPALVYSEFFKVPVIQVSSFGGLKYNYRTVGACTHPLLYPTQLHQRLYNLTKWDKLQQLYNHWWFEYFQWKVDREQEEMLKSIFGSDFPSLHDLSNNVDMLFLNVNPIWVENQPVPTNVVYMGGIHMTEPKELPQDLQTFLDSSKKGVIYFSLGTNVTPSVLSPTIIQMLVKVFSQLPYNVLWKWDKDELPGQTKNIKIFKWLPQTDLLKHPNVKLFITQGGLQSTDEAINAGVPLIGIPMLADQWYNVQKYLRFGIGVQLDFTSLTEEVFRNAIVTVAGDKRYRENVVKLRTLINDQPQSPLERVVWWTEHLLRHGGAKHLRAAGANISWADYLELELVLIVLSTLIFILIIITLFISMLWNFLTKYFKIDVKQKVS
ncbi:uncharacterized protein LOC124539191 [Vanessa cardui]|uniref:uncharacterized protein LOC124539191 n=1 Tax=Vanessa cardui TaxID=171605 RepID=UPI001F142F00|nr:uncharacterized protein LOC124539191 [Vanessa cardui]